MCVSCLTGHPSRMGFDTIGDCMPDSSNYALIGFNLVYDSLSRDYEYRNILREEQCINGSF
jgi:hypothetical protein